MHGITDWLASGSGLMVYAVVGGLVFCEDALFFGFVLPGETAVVLGGVIANQGRVSVYWLCAVVVFAAVLGDSVGYEVGRRLGPRILDAKGLRSHRERIGKAQDLIRRRGPVAVFLGRFIAFFRALMPALAGISRMPYRVFLAFNALGGLVWGVGFTLLGYFAGTAYKRIEHVAGTAVAATVAGVVVIALIVWHIRRRRRTGESDH
ncbi:DedA family protein [Streptomyces sp. HPF1205]|uniref:DedA family protein n=1 Tax=Streptomyces sp. HPF1205 TaxID=2873262 RepID=UPI001CED5C45|nr:DedA family protein [Streptomyces sp. HPF1205]